VIQLAPSKHKVQRGVAMSTLKCGIITLEGPRGSSLSPFVDGFKENACEVLVASKDSIWDFRRLDFILTYGPMESMIWVVHRLSSMEKVPPLFHWFTEQIPPPNLSTFAIQLASRFRYSFESRLSRLGENRGLVSVLFNRGGRLRILGEMLQLERKHLLRLIGVFTETNRLFLLRHGLPAVLIPMGYHSSFGENLNLDRDIDVVFLGSMDGRRKRLIHQLEDRFSKRGVTFVVKDGSPRRGGYVRGKERATLLNRTKIVLNIMHRPWDDPLFRFLLTAPNKALVLSEEIIPTSLGPLTAGEHFAMAELPDIAEATEYYLNRIEQRQQIADCAYELVTTKLTMKEMAQRVIRALGF
jgi:hypothetical protein